MITVADDGRPRLGRGVSLGGRNAHGEAEEECARQESKQAVHDFLQGTVRRRARGADAPRVLTGAPRITEVFGSARVARTCARTPRTCGAPSYPTVCRRAPCALRAPSRR